VQNYKKIFKQLIFIMGVLVLQFGCTTMPKRAGTEERLPPTDDYFYYSGKEKAGNVYCRRQHFVHPDTGKEAVLIGMIHIADVVFYEKVETICSKADLVLTEGVRGQNNLYPSALLLDYGSAVTTRMADAMGCVQQVVAFSLSTTNTVNADVTNAELSSNSTMSKELMAGLILPIGIAVIEPLNLIIQTDLVIGKVSGNNINKEAGLRHAYFSSRERHKDEERAAGKALDDSDDLFPGIIDARNEYLMSVFDQQMAKPEVQSIHIPWGANHHRDLEKRLQERGYQKTDSEWLRAIAVEDLLKGDVAPESSQNFYIPYIASAHEYNGVKGWSAVFGLISRWTTGDRSAFKLGYGYLYKSAKGEGYRSVAVLPQFFGRPLLFDYHNEPEVQQDRDKKWRFLLFFSL
jgi:hypothetical protein